GRNAHGRRGDGGRGPLGGVPGPPGPCGGRALARRHRDGARHGVGPAIPRAVFIAPPVQVPWFARAFAARLGLSPERAEGMLRKLETTIGETRAFDLLRLAPQQRAPLLVLHDRADREVPFAHGEALAAAWPGARLQPLANLGHRRMLREPRVLEEIVDFLREGMR